jgi:hypothetical protein
MTRSPLHKRRLFGAIFRQTPIPVGTGVILLPGAGELPRPLLEQVFCRGERETEGWLLIF